MQSPTCSKEELQVSDRAIERVMFTWIPGPGKSEEYQKVSFDWLCRDDFGQELANTSKLSPAGGIADWPCKESRGQTLVELSRNQGPERLLSPHKPQEHIEI